MRCDGYSDCTGGENYPSASPEHESMICFGRSNKTQRGEKEKKKGRVAGGVAKMCI